MKVSRFDQRWDLFGALRGRVGVDLGECVCRCSFCVRVEHKAAA